MAKTQVTVQLEPEFIEKIDQSVGRLGSKRSEVLRNLLEAGYETDGLWSKIKDTPLLKGIDELTEKIAVDRGHMMRNLLDMGYEDAQILDKIGVIDSFIIGGKVLKAIKQIKQNIINGKINEKQIAELVDK